MTPQHIAVLDDEPDITALLTTYLGANGFRVTPVHTGSALMDLMERDPPALVLLDLGLPGEDGFAIARRLREHWHCGLVIVSGRGDAVDKVVGLEIGADDYVTKPFDLRELLARVKAVLRRTLDAGAAGAEAGDAAAPQGPAAARGAANPNTRPNTREDTRSNHHLNNDSKDCERWRFADWVLDLRARRLIGPDGVEVGLTGGEFDLLCVFVRHPGRVLSRDFLLESTRGREAAPFDRTIDVQVGRLRKKLELDSQNPQLLKSVRTAGYVLVPSVQAERSR